MRLLILVFAGSLFTFSPAFAEDVPSGLVALRARLADQMAGWTTHRNQKIAVLDIQGIQREGKDEKTQLDQRLETLQNKKISNREWSDYWAGEGRFAKEIQASFSALVPSSGESPLIAVERSKTRQANGARILAGSKEEVATRVREKRDGLEGKVTDVITGQAAAVSEAEALLAEALKAQHIADEGSDAAAKKAAVDRVAVAHTAVDGLVAVRQGISEVVSGSGAVPEGLDAALKALLTDYVAARDAADTAATESKDAETKAKTLETAALAAKADRHRFMVRRGALTQWVGLAKSKVVNQQKYYEAIEADIDAINERLQSLEVPVSDEEKPTLVGACNPDTRSKDSAYVRHRACIESVQRKIERVEHELEQLGHKKELTEKLQSSIAQLIVAQTKDEVLVKEEVAISVAEWKRAVADPQETAAWRGAWKVYADKSQAKVAKLTNALVTSKQAERTHKAKLGVYKDQLTRKEISLAAEQAALGEVDTVGNSVVALVKTFLNIIKVGWPALIYLLVAYLLIRFISRYRDRQEDKAARAQDGEIPDELREILQELDRAKASDDEAEVIQLNEQVVQMESRIKDEAQRMATISRVAAQALSLIIYIATSLLVLDAMTVDIGPILGGAAIFGLAISFGSQSLVKDVVSGFFILLENQYAVGDVVSINGQGGVVEKVTLRRTVLRDGNGGVHNITNGSISAVINSTQGWARAVLDLGVGYDSDIDHVRDVINQVGEEMYDDPKWAGKLTEKPAFVGVTSFGASEVMVRAQFKTKTFQNWGAEREFNYRIKTAFEQAGIDIPYPNRTVHLIHQKTEDA